MKKTTVRTRAFTLIELMIAIAIIAIMFAGVLLMTKSSRYAKELYYEEGVNELRRLNHSLDESDYDSFPPELVKVPQNKIVQLKYYPVIPASLSIYHADGTMGADYRADFKRGRLEFLSDRLIGKKLLIHYNFEPAVTGEGAVIPDKAPYRIRVSNYPVLELIDVKTVNQSGEKSIKPELYTLDPQRGEITFDTSLSGKVVRIIYRGQRIKSICTSSFVDKSFNMSLKDTGMKLMKIRIDYGGRREIEAVKLKVRRR